MYLIFNQVLVIGCLYTEKKIVKKSRYDYKIIVYSVCLSNTD